MREIFILRYLLQPTLIFAATMALALAGSVLLWAEFSTTVFFEVVRNGVSVCG